MSEGRRRNRKKNILPKEEPKSVIKEEKDKEIKETEKEILKEEKKKEESSSEEEEEKQIEKIELIPGSLKIDILLNISSMQHQNGLRVNDYLRYSHFCRKKIQKLRKLNNLSQGKRKFQKLPITAELVKDNKIFLILILECERNWAYGMYHKQELTAIGQDIKRLRYEITRKFRKASKTALEIFDICKKIGDTQTQLEGEAYYNYIYSNYLIFTRKFKEALELLKKASNIYEKISQLKDTIESIEYKEKIKSMKTSMRLCIYNLSTEKDAILDEEEFEKTVNVEDIALTEKIEEIKKNVNNISNESDYNIKYHGITIPIKNQKLKDHFEKLNDLNSKIIKEKEISKKIPLFQDYYNRIDEMNKLVKKIKTEEVGESTENFSKIYSSILTYIENLRLKKYIDKNLSYISDYQKEFNTIENINNLFEKENLKLKIKPHEIMRLYDNLKEYQSQLINLEKDNPEQSYILDLNFREKVYTLCKIYYAGLFYLLNKKYQETYTIMFYTIDKIKEANEFFDQHHLNSVSTLSELKNNISNLEKLSLFIINSCYSKMSLENINKNINEIENKKDSKKIKYQPYLYDIIQKGNHILSKENYESLKDYIINLPYQDYIDNIKNTNFNNYSQIIQVPMNSELLEPKPIIFDLAFDKIEFPDLIEKCKTQQKSLMGRAFGYFFGSK